MLFVFNIAEIKKFTWKSKIKTCLIGSDGFWDMIRNQEAVDLLLKNNSFMVFKLI